MMRCVGKIGAQAAIIYVAKGGCGSVAPKRFLLAREQALRAGELRRIEQICAGTTQ